MERLDRIVGKLALPLVVVTVIGVPLAAFAYDRSVRDAAPEGAKVFWIYLDGERNWTTTRLSGLTTFRDPDDLREIVVDQGDLVVLKLMSTDVHHGFTIAELGMEPIELVPGKVHEVRFVADRPGRYRMVCTIICGRAHPRMAADLVVRA
jgi:heme/copper-type cytochrome/quinol oxidase subunit 2